MTEFLTKKPKLTRMPLIQEDDTANFESRCGFTIRMNEEDEAFQNCEIEHRNTARQTIENIMRIAFVVP